MRLQVVLHLTGVLVRLFGVTLVAPACVSALYREWHDTTGFVVAGTVSILLGTWMRRARMGGTAQAAAGVRHLEGMAIVASTWLVVAHGAAIPYLWAGLTPVDALFESMSGLTTTGATVLTEFEALGRGMFFWRALTQWVGGLGVIALFVAVLPRLAVGGRELFFAEAPGPMDETLVPQLRQSALALWRLYTVLTVAEAVALTLAGMSVFDAVCHSMTTLAAGGFSPNALSISGYGSGTIEWIVVGFMFLAGANFALQYRVVMGNLRAIRQDEELHVYAGIALLATVVLSLSLFQSGMDSMDALRHGAFQAISILTTTGYASTDFQQWSDQAKVVLLLLMFVGGCAGSAAGGPKIMRHLLMARSTLRELRRAMHRRAVLPVKLGGRIVPESVLRNVQIFIYFYLIVFAAGTMLVVSLGADVVTGITASIACLGNIGPGLGGVGPMGNFAGLHPISKIVLTFEMWIGRLEVLTVLVFFRLEPWRSIRWTAH